MWAVHRASIVGGVINFIDHMAKGHLQNDQAERHYDQL
jgi:hypothetical protein